MAREGLASQDSSVEKTAGEGALFKMGDPFVIALAMPIESESEKAESYRFNQPRGMNFRNRKVEI
jgi:hypothetical protein